jgi:YjbE family integral membrane protein
LPEFLSGNFFIELLLVMFTNVVLSGDNAVVIAMAARCLEGPRRWQALIWASACAVVLCLIFAYTVSYLLALPFLQAAGGLLVFWIAWKLVHDNHAEEGRVRAGTNVWDTIWLIVVAELVMSLDNMVALVGVAKGNFLLLAIGLTLTVPLIIFGSALLAVVLDRLPGLTYAAGTLVVYISIEMIFEDVALKQYFEPYPIAEWVVAAVAIVAFLTITWVGAKRTGEDALIKEDFRKSWQELQKQGRGITRRDDCP